MQLSNRISKLEEIAKVQAVQVVDSEQCSCDEVACYPYNLFLKCVNPGPAHPQPCYRDWVFDRLVSEQRTVVKGRCAKCEADLGYLWDLTKTPEAEQRSVLDSDPHDWDDIHYRIRLVRAGSLDFVDWAVLEDLNDAQPNHTH